MNNLWFIWYPMIEAIQEGYDTTKIHYRVKDRKFFIDLEDEQLRYLAGAHHISPLLEYMPLVLYDPDKKVTPDERFARVDINPYHRFGKIFEKILIPDRNDPNDLIVSDIMVHILAHIDRICGMSKRDFRILQIMKELGSGYFEDGTRAIDLFSLAEQRALAEALLMLYDTSNSLRCLDNLFNVIMTDFNIMLRDNEEVVFYNPYGCIEREDKKLRFIIKLFLPIDFPSVIHWRYTYGTVEHDESILLEKFVL
jgi:hypothetical protein